MSPFLSNQLPEMGGRHVVVLGCGDTAFDCALSAYRCGAERVFHYLVQEVLE